ncbi:cytochrome o ubiquinol oxidase subunit IV [Novosphingobium sp. ZN18A2]|uniref:cytochrome o ubiquinol oxidase subunit IV n=1 Tax=Novosphingobium sp. ZN18A2 TaxID=3079861 RepID=UPI0030CCCFF9
MSTAPAPHDHSNGHGDHLDNAPHGSFGGYMTGFLLSVILTAIPFALVMTGTLDKNVTLILILAMAIVQIFVHMVYFLHMNMKVEDGWSMLALIFTVVFVVITLAGSMWVLYHMNDNMMPMTPVASSSAGMTG